MKASTIKRLRDGFVGKPCSIFVQQSARPLTEQQFADYFVGIIAEIDEDGIYARHTVTNCMNFIALDKVLAICEEQILYPDNPEHAKVIENFKKQAETEQDTVPIPGMGDSPYVDISNMEAMMQQAKSSGQTSEKEKK